MSSGNGRRVALFKSQHTTVLGYGATALDTIVFGDKLFDQRLMITRTIGINASGRPIDCARKMRKASLKRARVKTAVIATTHQ